METLSSIHAWRIPWTEEPDGLQSIGPQRVRYDSRDLALMHHWGSSRYWYFKCNLLISQVWSFGQKIIEVIEGLNLDICMSLIKFLKLYVAEFLQLWNIYNSNNSILMLFWRWNDTLYKLMHNLHLAYTELSRNVSCAWEKMLRQLR